MFTFVKFAQVQPVSELVELSKRCMPPQGIGIVANADDEVDRAARNANCNTLKRSASKRFKQQVSDCILNVKHEISLGLHIQRFAK